MFTCRRDVLNDLRTLDILEVEDFLTEARIPFRGDGVLFHRD